MTYAEAIEFLSSLSLFGVNLGLENTAQLAELAGNPHRRLRFIHVAGTNGKGSTCAMLESVYRAAGLRVGLFTSPHLVSFRERLQVDRQLISESDVARLVEELRRQGRAGFQFAQTAETSSAISESMGRPDTGPTFFEFVTIMALRYFEEQGCDLVIWETGLGGRLDATNIVTPLASVITNIQFDHENWLGQSLDRIASEKAGIIKPGVPVLTAAENEEALAIIRETAQRHGSLLTIVARADAYRAPLDSIQLPLLGEHQKLNAAVALATVRAMNRVVPVSDAALRKGLESVRWPGRLQIIRTDDGRTILLDGAHNPAGVETLRAALAQYFPDAKPALIFGTMRDKNWPQMCRTLAPLFGRILLTPVGSERSARPADLESASRAANPSAEIATCDSLGEALRRTAVDPFVVITGSLHFIGEATTALRLMPNPDHDERGLNEWTAVTKR